MSELELLSTLEAQAQLASRLINCKDFEKALAFGRRIHHNIRGLKNRLIEVFKDAKRTQRRTRKRK